MNNTKPPDQSQEHFSGNIGKTDENLFLPPTEVPAQKKNLSVPFPTFGAVPFDLIDQELDRVGITGSSPYLLFIRLFGLVDWAKTVRIGCHDFMTGITGYLSDKAIQKLMRAGSNHTARKAMKSLVDAELVIKLDKEAGHKCPRYYIALFAPVIAFLKENPPTTVKVEYLAQNEAFDARFNHTQKDNPKPVLDKDAETAHNQEFKKERAPVPAVLGSSTGIASSMPTVEEKAKGESPKPEPVESSTVKSSPPSKETQEERPEEKAKESLKGEASQLSFPLSDESSSPGTIPSHNPDIGVYPPPAASDEHLDVVPNGHLGAMLDGLSESKRMGAAPSVENLEDFMTAFDPDAPAVSTWKHAEVASKLSRHLGELLASAGVSMPPLLFFKKHCVPRMEDLIRDGTIQSRPQSLNFFLTAVRGKQLVSDCLSKLRSVDQSAASIERANQEIRKVTRDAPSDEFKSQVAGMLDSEFGVGWRDRL